MKKIASAVFVSTLFCAHAAKAEIRHNDPIYWSNQDWVVYSYPSEYMCELSTKGAKGEMFTYAVFPKYNARFLMFAVPGVNPTAYSNEYKLRLVLVPDLEKWGEQDFTVGRSGEYTSFKSPNMPISFEDDLVHSEVLAIADFARAGKATMIAAISLRGASDGLTKLRECISKVE